METTTVLLIAIPIVVVLGVIVLVAAARRQDTARAIGVVSRETRKRDRGSTTPSASEGKASAAGKEVELVAAREQRGTSKALVSAGASAPVAWVPPDPDTLGATRRQFLNRSIVGYFVVGLSGFGAAVLAFLWPSGGGGGFGSKIRVGNVEDVKADIDANNGFLYKPEGRMWVTRYPEGGLEKARAVYSPGELAGMEAGLIALYQKCPHLGCRVPECVTSQWFECPCHGSQYNRVGEKKGGPAPRGMDRFAMSVDNGVFVVDTAAIIDGPPIGTNTTGQEAEGPNCIGAATAH